MNDDEGYKEIAEEAGGKFMKNRDQNELKLIKNFITKINNGTLMIQIKQLMDLEN